MNIILVHTLGYACITGEETEARRGQGTCIESHNQGMVWQKVSTCQILGYSASTEETIYKGCYFVSVMGYNGVKKEACDLQLDRLGFNSSNAIYECVKCFKFLLYNENEQIHFIELTGLW